MPTKKMETDVSVDVIVLPLEEPNTNPGCSFYASYLFCGIILNINLLNGE